MLHLFWKNTYSLQANNSSKIFSLPLVIVAPNEDYIMIDLMLCTQALRYFNDQCYRKPCMMLMQKLKRFVIL